MCIRNDWSDHYCVFVECTLWLCDDRMSIMNANRVENDVAHLCGENRWIQNNKCMLHQ